MSHVYQVNQSQLSNPHVNSIYMTSILQFYRSCYCLRDPVAGCLERTLTKHLQMDTVLGQVAVES